MLPTCHIKCLLPLKFDYKRLDEKQQHFGHFEVKDDYFGHFWPFWSFLANLVILVIYGHLGQFWPFSHFWPFWSF